MNNFIDEVLQRANIVNIISKYVSLKKTGANYFGICPFHPDTNPSMSVSDKKGIFKCFSCGASGNAITFIQKYKNISFIEALKEVALESGFTSLEIENKLNNNKKDSSNKFNKPYDINEQANDLFKFLLTKKENNLYYQYLLSRKLSKEIIEKFNFGFSSLNSVKNTLHETFIDQNHKKQELNKKVSNQDLLNCSLISINENNNEICDYFFNRITLPIKNKYGAIIGFIGRNINNAEPKYLLSRQTPIFQKSKCLYNIDNVFNSNCSTLIILEGNIDLISLYQAGLDTSLSCPIALMGTTLTSYHINLIESIKSIKNIILCFDNDDAGFKSTITNGLTLLKSGFNNLTITLNNTSCKDINEILIKKSKQEVLNLFNDSNQLDFLIFYINYQLTNVPQNDLVSKVNDCLQLIINYANPLFLSKYKQQISKLTNLDKLDIENTINKLNNNRFSSSNKFATTQSKKQIPTNDYGKQHKNILNLLMKNLNVLLKCIFLDTALSQVYDKMNFINFYYQAIKDSYYLIKLFALEEEKLNLNQVIEKIKKTANDNSISLDSANSFLTMIDDLKIQEQNGVLKTISLKKANELADRIQLYIQQLRLIELEDKLIKSKDLQTDPKTKIKQQILEIKKVIKQLKLK